MIGAPMNVVARWTFAAVSPCRSGGVFRRDKAFGCRWVALVVALVVAPAGAMARAEPGEVVLRGHEGAVFAAQLTPDGERAVTAATDGTVRLWDATTGAEFRRFAGHTGPVTGVAISGDGRTLATSSQDTTVRVWDLPLTRPLVTRPAHARIASALALAPDGRALLTAGHDPLARLWDTPKLVEAAAAIAGGAPPPAGIDGGSPAVGEAIGPARAVAWRSDGAQYLLADDTGRIIVGSPFLDAPLGTLGVHGGGVVATSFMPGNPQQILSAGVDGTLRLWQGPPVAGRTATVAAGVRDLLPLPGPPVAAVAREDGGLQLIDLATMQPVRDLPTGAPIHSLAATTDGSSIVIGDDAGRVRWVTSADGVDRGTLGGHAGGVLDVAPTADGAIVFTAGADGTVRQWARPVAGTPLDGHAQGVKLAVPAADGQWFATTGDDRTLRIWSGAGQPLRTVGTHEQTLSALAISADGRGLAAGDAAGAVALWNPQDGASAGVVLAHQGMVRAIAHQRDGRALWTAGTDGTIKRTTLPLPVPRTFAGHGQAVRAIVTTADGRGAFSAGQDGVVRQWDLASGQGLRSFGEGAGAWTALAVNAEGSLVAAVSESGSVRAWRVADGAVAFVANLAGVALRDVAILPAVDGLHRLVTVGDDQRLRLWALAATPVADGKDVVPMAELPLAEAGTDRLAVAADGSWLSTCGAGRIVRRFRVDAAGIAPIDGGFTAGAARITDIAFSPDGAWFAAGGEDGKVTLWDARTLLAATGEVPPLRTLAARAAVRGLAFDPGRPAAAVATASDDGVVATWDPATGHQRERFAAPGGIAAVAVGHGAVLAAGADPAIRVWTPAVDLVLEVTPGLASEGAARLVALPGERGIAALVPGARELRRWNLDGQPLPGVVGADAPAAHLATSADGLQAVVATAAGQAWIWNLATDALTGPIGLGNGVTTVALGIPAAAGEVGQILVGDALPRLRAIDPGSGVTVEEMTLPFPAVVALSTGAAGPGPGGTGALGRNWVAFGTAPQGILKPRCWVRTLITAPAAINAVALSADGSRVGAAGEDGRVAIVRTADGVREQGYEGGQVSIRELAWVSQPPSIAAACADGNVRIWPVGTVAEPRILGGSVPLVSVAVSADGSRLATLSESGRVELWSLATDAPLQSFPGHAAGRGRVRFLGDQLSVLSGSSDRTVRQVKGTALRSLRVGAEPITSLAIVGGQVVVASADGGVRSVDVQGNTPLRQIAAGLAAPVILAPRPDGQRLAVGDGAGRIGIWDPGGWQRLEELTASAATMALGWSGDGRTLVVATASTAPGKATLEVFGAPPAPATAAPGRECFPHQTIPTTAVTTALAVDAEGRGVWCLDDDGMLRAWGLAALDARRRFDSGSPVLAVAISRDGGTVVSGGNDQSVRVWDPASGQQRAQLTGHTGPVLALALTPDDAMVVSASGDLTLRLWDLAGGRALKQLAATDEAVYSLAVHPSGRTVAAGGADRAIHLHDILGGGIERSFRGHADFVDAVAFNRQGTRLLSYGYAGVLKIWNPADGTLLHDTVVGRIGNAATWGAAAGGSAPPGGVDDRIVAACGDGTVRIVVVPASAR